ncbi:MAG: MoxR family ATPase [Planctomycetes bacterium]|nr:MoxR family ATPase [Planctomycetota bacterium]
MSDSANAASPDRLTRIQQARDAVIAELKKGIVGQEVPMRHLITAMFAGGHCMIQGPLASAKTVLVASLAKVMELDFKRIQFTPDLMPADISGTEILEEDDTGHRVSKFVRGPVFTNVLMADEINRTPPKTQAALLEVMQEKQVTLGGQTHPLPKPFFVLATQVSMEQEGTYPLPEAQQDRFMFSIRMDYLAEEEEMEVVKRSTGAEQSELSMVIKGEDLIDFSKTVRAVKLPPELGAYIVDIVANSRPTEEGAKDFVKEYVVWGAGLRASQNISLAAKSSAAQDGRDTVTMEDIANVIHPVLRHRIGLSFRAEVDRVSVDDLIERLLKETPLPSAATV